MKWWGYFGIAMGMIPLVIFLTADKEQVILHGLNIVSGCWLLVAWMLWWVAWQ